MEPLNYLLILLFTIPAVYGISLFSSRQQRSGQTQRVLFAVALILLSLGCCACILLHTVDARELIPVLWSLYLVATVLFFSLLFIFILRSFYEPLFRSFQPHYPLTGAVGVVLGFIMYDGVVPAHLLLIEVELAEPFNTIHYGPFMPFVHLLISVLIGAQILLLVFGCFLREFYRRNQARCLLTGLAAPTVIYAFLVLFYRKPFFLPLLTTSLFVSFAVLAVHRYRLLAVTPQRERSVDPASFRSRTMPLRKQRSSLMLHPNPDIGFVLFTEHVRKGLQGLLVTRDQPEMVREEYCLETTPIIWLTDVNGKDRLDGTRLERLAHTMIEFIESCDDGIIYLQALAYLLSVNRFGPVLSMLQDIRDHVSLNNARFVVTIHPELLTEEQLQLLKSELELFTGHPYPTRKLKGAALQHYVDFIRNDRDAKHLDLISEEVGLDCDAIDPKGWYPAMYGILFSRAIKRYFEAANENVIVEIGRASVRGTTFFKRLLLRAISLRRALEMLDPVWSSMSNFGKIEVEVVDSSTVLVRFDQVVGDKYDLDQFQGIFEALLEFKHKEGRIRRVGSIFTGDRVDEFRIEWH